MQMWKSTKQWSEPTLAHCVLLAVCFKQLITSDEVFTIIWQYWYAIFCHFWQFSLTIKLIKQHFIIIIIISLLITAIFIYLFCFFLTLYYLLLHICGMISLIQCNPQGHLCTVDSVSASASSLYKFVVEWKHSFYLTPVIFYP